MNQASSAVHDVLAIGNAIVDVLSHANDEFLAGHNLTKGAMTLVDAKQATALYAAMGPGVEVSGGSAANTAAGIASFGGTAAFIGKVGDDQLGEVFSHDIRAAGVSFNSVPTVKDEPTGRCLIVVTQDAQRTMQTFLGASAGLGPEDVDEALVAASRVTYLEGYLWDPPLAKEAFVKAAEIAEGAGRKVALSLSDSFCVDRHRAEFLDLVNNHVHILFANEAEITSLYEAGEFDEALQRIRGHCEIAALTRSEKGSVIVTGDEVHVLDAAAVGQVVDTTGAGDSYAAGFLYGYTRGEDPAVCGHFGGIAAAEIISHFGARPERPLSQLVGAA